MTILRKFLIFNKPIEEIECQQCRGSGKWKTSPTGTYTGIYLFFLGMGIIVFMLNVATKQRISDVVGFGIFLILAALTLIEIKEQNARI